ncbi:preprotein translocase subunit YajC [Corynebacterium sp. CCM 9185]|uniref:Preprotein translocase subunit YajC n=1 Tax=Corynebacterium marambiense TaxID=2765364 RepID=A0ABS0VUY8_9CORY|nr:preprotein translocase subunit YajC [Corynebacterium marambiense]MBI9000581.1 preprotein translocase subunit YajC [Corynebacterium marambiense]MCK7663156.1 preprotein translocase subunit YajC [Corynebacterium marambiense]MCX7542770.1 preprotein translocase subunit YajC [Corynebacterium marambiense]
MELLLLAAIAAVFIIPTTIQARRQRRRMEEIQALQDSLRAGDRVVTTSGVHGVVRGMSDELVDLEIAVGVTMTWERSAIIRKVDSATATRQTGDERFWEDDDVLSGDDAQEPAGESAQSDPGMDTGTDVAIERDPDGTDTRK